MAARRGWGRSVAAAGLLGAGAALVGWWLLPSAEVELAESARPVPAELLAQARERAPATQWGALDDGVVTDAELLAAIHEVARCAREADTLPPEIRFGHLGQVEVGPVAGPAAATCVFDNLAYVSWAWEVGRSEQPGEVRVFLQPDATAAQRATVEQAVTAAAHGPVRFVDEDETRAEVERWAAGNPSLGQVVEGAGLPTSFRFLPADRTPAAFDELVARLGALPGVRDVVDTAALPS